MRWSLLLVLAACGRLDFASHEIDAQADVTLANHDEDGDGIDDALDPCPYTAGDAADEDHDGVGDACDPHPTTPGDHWTFFSPCTPASPPPFELANFTQHADSVESMGFGVDIATPIATGRIALGFTILGRIGTDQHQIALGASTVPFYFVELNDNGNDLVHYLGVTYQHPADMGYDDLAQSQLATDVHTGSGSMTIDADLDTKIFATEAGWVGERYTTSASTASYVGAPAISFADTHLDLELEYIALISTD